VEKSIFVSAWFLFAHCFNGSGKIVVINLRPSNFITEFQGFPCTHVIVTLRATPTADVLAMRLSLQGCDNLAGYIKGTRRSTSLSGITEMRRQHANAKREQATSCVWLAPGGRGSTSHLSLVGKRERVRIHFISLMFLRCTPGALGMRGLR